MFCKVNYCRFSATHTTPGHKCGTCNTFGHGQAECRDPVKIELLKQYNSDTLPYSEQCKIDGCNSKSIHNTDTHYCDGCSNRYPECDCVCAKCSKEVKLCICTFECPLCRTVNKKIEIKEIKGSDSECVICKDAQVQCLFLTCSHASVCKSCMVQLTE